MFSGIGGFRAGLDRAGGFECIGHCEIDKYADASYRAMHNIREEEVYYSDARSIDPAEMPEFQLLCSGLPCQSYSQAGTRKGLNDPRGALFFDMARLVEAKRPAFLLIENVPGLLSQDHGRALGTILSTLNDLGYGIEWSPLFFAEVPGDTQPGVFQALFSPSAPGAASYQYRTGFLMGLMVSLAMMPSPLSPPTEPINR